MVVVVDVVVIVVVVVVVVVIIFTFVLFMTAATATTTTTKMEKTVGVRLLRWLLATASIEEDEVLVPCMGHTNTHIEISHLHAKRKMKTSRRFER